ncbi:hypothetical protein [Sporisorium scitamineum]|uniref:Uncharacterized protein n=1 Tax=Sporisorium scitamineum TaxID=49012 RepID=A0A0F7S936_9BASI|nr:hypothetical protein [Sporisorium scitamineum]
MCVFVRIQLGVDFTGDHRENAVEVSQNTPFHRHIA